MHISDRHASCIGKKNNQPKQKKPNTTVKMREEEMGRNLKLYCTTLYHRSNGLTSQLLANGIMGKQRQEKDKDNDVRGPRQNNEQLP